MAAGTPPNAPDDPLRILAVRTAECLDGGRAAILRPERRRRLLRIAHMLGVGQFDAHLVFAIVQDNARRGAAPDAAVKDPRLNILAPPARRTRNGAWLWIVPQMLAALAIGAVMLLAMIRWLGG
ncbi:MAG: hypothetical protein IBJ10_10895 [Phycisphaerales bacterium]|nr:hypothetical protein [Phycisphaerales bacterium]